MGQLALLVTIPIISLYNVAFGVAGEWDLYFSFKHALLGILFIAGFAGGIAGVIVNLKKIWFSFVLRTKDFSPLNELDEDEATKLVLWLNTSEYQATSADQLWGGSKKCKT